MLLLLLFAFLAGIVTVLSPCILPVLPIILSAGMAKGAWRPLGIIIGLIISFTFFTLLLTVIVSATGISPNVLRYIAIGLIALFGVIMLFPGLSALFAKWTAPIAHVGQTVQERGPKSGFIGGLALGCALGLLWTPCAGPILAAITTLVALQQITTTTFLITLSYAIGAAIPMFLIAYGGGKIVQSSRFLSMHSERIRQVFGALMILAAIAIGFNWDMALQKKITTLVPPVLVEDNSLVRKELTKLHPGKGGNKALSHAVVDRFADYGKAPEIIGITNWINSPPLSLMKLQGKVVLIDFWTYSCINCVRTLPYIEKWFKKYKNHGFVVIGVHTPEFEFEKDPMNVAAEAHLLGVTYPIAQDNHYKTWEAFNNQYWPAHYLIDQKGNLRLMHFGEGGYDEMENGIRDLLGMAPLPMEKKTESLRPVSPETYLGLARGNSYTPENRIVPNKVAIYDYHTPLARDQVGLKGAWKVDQERIISEGDSSYLESHFQASQVYIVLSGSSHTPLQVYLDGKLVKEISVDADRMYTIADTIYGSHTLSLKVPKGISAYTFTFGINEPIPIITAADL